MGNQMDTAIARAILGGQVAIRKSGPATFGQLQARQALARITKVATFADLEKVTELREWLPQGSDALAQVLGAALLAMDAEMSGGDRMQAAITAVEEFKNELLSRLADGIQKRHGRGAAAPPVRKGASNWTDGIL